MNNIYLPRIPKRLHPVARDIKWFVDVEECDFWEKCEEYQDEIERYDDSTLDSMYDEHENYILNNIEKMNNLVGQLKEGIWGLGRLEELIEEEIVEMSNRYYFGETELVGVKSSENLELYVGALERRKIRVNSIIEELRDITSKMYDSNAKLILLLEEIDARENQEE